MAKKTVVAVGVIIALGAIWTGASWITGQQIEKHIGEATDSLNNVLKTNYPNSRLKVAYRDYQRGVFTSRLALVVQTEGEPSADKEIVVNAEISHGPFPIRPFSLAPVMASVHAELANTEAVKPLFEMTSNKPFISADSRISYNGDTHSTVTLLALDTQSPDTKLNFSGASLQLNLSSDLRAAEISGTLGSLLMEKNRIDGVTEKLSLQGMALSSNTHKGTFDIDLGDNTLTLKKLALDIQEGDSVTINDLALTSQVSEDTTNLAGKSALTLGSIMWRDQNLGSLMMNINFSGFDGKGAKQFATEYHKTYREMLRNIDDNTTADAYTQQLSSVVLHNLPLLLKGNPTISVAPLSWKNAKGESTFTFAIDMTDPLQKAAATPAAPAQSDEETLFRNSVKKVDAKLNVPLDMITELMVQTAPKATSDEQKKQTETMARQQTQLMANIGQMSQVTVTQNNAITSTLQYADGLVTFNARKIPLAEFLAPFISIPTQEGTEEEGDDDAQTPAEPSTPTAK
ncbi:YdgA family protein [Musicola paradisiaca]|uniref:DUF945 domain-containing protein n=1 Tax=Musicola paradisiaca (strain Ech703) TaxID=579405 RepID=C6C583_MUSP7|nr:YdgA family protein [Musicola paradisiaca]ACS85693.1 protein of unknown function DUF945 [Musicola paradisiaca Ech703]